MKNFTLLICCLLCGLITINAQNLELRDVADYPVDLSDVWGYSDGEREYAILGLLNAFTIVDVTDPDNIVKLFQNTVDGPVTFWRDVKTYGHYAYGVHDGPFSGESQGLVIMDLQYLPDSMPYAFYTDGGQLTESHNIYIDERGIAYLAGHDRGGSGVLMLDIATDPWNPVIVGQYSNGYVHDCFVRNDTLWTSDGNVSFGGAGQKRFSIVDVAEPANPVLLGSGATPGGYSHNIWPSDDGRTAFTTDETSGAFIAAHDVSDPSDITEIDRYRSNPGSNVIPHNVTVLDDFLVISYYRDGVIILDASLPDELVETGRYDTSPNLWGSGFNGCWGVYPYLPSGNILAADIERGLHVLTPTYTRAAHIRGTVRDAQTGNTINGADVSIIRGTDTLDLSTDLGGKFKKGYAEGGTFTVLVSAPGYTTYEDHLILSNGDVVDLEILLTSGNYLGNRAWLDGNENGIQDKEEEGLPGVEVRLLDAGGNVLDTAVTDTDGRFVFLDLAAGSYGLRYLPPADGITRYIATTANAGGDDALDSDLIKTNNSYRIPEFTLTSSGSFLIYDGGFRVRPQTEPVDTIAIEVGTGETVQVCDDALENGVSDPVISEICTIEGDTAGAAFDAQDPGCLNFTAGNEEAGPIQVCVITGAAEGGVTDTTIFSVTVSAVLAAPVDGFESGALQLLQNPVRHMVYLRNRMADRRSLRIMVTDLQGRRILQTVDDGGNNLISLRVDGLSRGMYLLAVFSERDLLGISRFIKQ